VKQLLVVGALVLFGCVGPRAVAPSSSTAPASPTPGYPGDAPLLEAGKPAPFDCVCLNDPKAREWYAAPQKCRAELESYKTTNKAAIFGVVGGAVAAVALALTLGYELGRATK
jgi:hypothetical protein